MRGLGLLLFLLIAVSISAHAHTAFTLVSSERKTIKDSDLPGLEKGQTAGKHSGTQIAFTERDIRLVVTTGPEDDMLSYRIQGMRNPTLVVPTGVTMRILFVNTDTDMRHDVRFGHIKLPFDIAPPITETAGSQKLIARTEDGTLQAEEIVVKA